MSDQKYPAKYVVFWPGREVKACQNHYQQFVNLGAAMGGAPLSFRLLADIGESGECGNCVNESRRKP